MTLLADVVLNPGGIISWIVVGLIAGWLAGSIMRGRGYGMGADIILGLIGAMVGGFLSGFFIHGSAGFLGSILIAVLGACVLIALVRTISPRQI